MNKRYILMVVVLLAIVAMWLTLHAEKPNSANLAYQKQLDRIVKYREFMGLKKDIQGWSISVEIPKNPPLEQWDKVHTQPQLMFVLWGDRSELFTMNIDGTGVHKLLDSAEIGNIPHPGWMLRSPNGRYLMPGYTQVGQLCVIYDLKERIIINDAVGCVGGYFSRDSKYYYYGDYRKSGPSKLALETNKITNLVRGKVELDGKTYYGSGQRGGYFKNTWTYAINEPLDRLTWTARHHASRRKTKDSSDIVACEQFTYRLSDMSLLGKQDFWATACAQGYYYQPGPDYRHIMFVNQHKKDYKLYAYNAPKTLIEKAPANVTIQPGKFYLSNKKGQLSYIFRYRQEGETGKFESMKFSYKMNYTDKDFTIAHGLNLFIPESMLANFEQRDLRPLFPHIPTEQEYQASYQRQLAERNDKKDKR